MMMFRTQIQRSMNSLLITKKSANAFSRSTYFLKGQDSRELSATQMQELASYVNEDPLGSSFLVYNSSEVRRKVGAWRKKLSWVEPYYGLKANSMQQIVKDLSQKGVGLTVESKNEIQIGLNCGVAANRMIYSNPVKEERDIAFAAANSVQYTTADTVDELLKVKAIAPNMKILWSIAIPDHYYEEEENGEVHYDENGDFGFTNKFGDEITSIEQAHERFSYIASEIGVQLHGIHFDCGQLAQGHATDAAAPLLLNAVKIARKCMEIGRIYGHPMETMDIGGGFMGANDLDEKVISVLLKNTYQDPLGYQIVAEPSRYFSQHSCHLFTRVLSKKVKQQGHLNYFHVNDSRYQSFNTAALMQGQLDGESAQVYGSVLNEGKFVNRIKSSKSEAVFTSSSIVGMTGSEKDVIAEAIHLPDNLKTGDWLCFGGMGSYTYNESSSHTTRVYSRGKSTTQATTATTTTSNIHPQQQATNSLNETNKPAKTTTTTTATLVAESGF